MIKFLGYLWKIQKDHDGEIRLILTIPKTENSQLLMLIPEEKNLEVTIEEYKSKE